MTLVLLAAALFLALSNGANDNFKGLATVWGSHTLGYRSALAIATVATLAGGLLSLLISDELVKTFSGNGLVPADVVAAPGFTLSVALGAGTVIMAATRIGMPVSTSHALIGGLVGAGVAVAGNDINLQQLGEKFVLPLLASPLLAGALGLAAYRAQHFVRNRKQGPDCICVVQPSLAVNAGGAMSATAAMAPHILIAPERECDDIASPHVRMSTATLRDRVHLISAASICLARGVNDAPKIAALLLAAQLSGVQASVTLVAAAMAIGGLLFARRVAETMSLRLNHLDPAQGLAANLITAGLVITASRYGLPVSTTHISVGSISGTGVAAATIEWSVLKAILLSWVAILPVAAVLAWAAALVIG